jgi:hypothetical protein
MSDAWAKFSSAFWEGFDSARAKAPAPLDATHPFAALNETEAKASISAAMRAAYDAGNAAEKARVAEILQAPNAAHFLELAVDLALGTATGAQAVAVLSRAETDAAKRATLLKSSPLEASAHTVH